MKRSAKVLREAGQVAAMGAILAVTGVAATVWAVAVGIQAGAWWIILAAAAFAAAGERITECARLRRVARKEKSYEFQP